MTQKYVNGDANGNIIAFYSDDINENIPSNAVRITDEQWKDAISNIGKYIISNAQMVLAPAPSAAQQLANAKTAKLLQLRQSLENAISAFTSNALGTVNTYLGDQQSMTFLAAEYSYIRSSDYKGETINYYTKEQGRVAHTGAQLAQVFLDGRSNATNQYAHFDSLVADVQASTTDTVDKVNAITW